MREMIPSMCCALMGLGVVGALVLFTFRESFGGLKGFGQSVKDLTGGVKGGDKDVSVRLALRKELGLSPTDAAYGGLQGSKGGLAWVIRWEQDAQGKPWTVVGCGRTPAAWDGPPRGAIAQPSELASFGVGVLGKELEGVWSDQDSLTLYADAVLWRMDEWRVAEGFLRNRLRFVEKLLYATSRNTGSGRPTF